MHVYPDDGKPDNTPRGPGRVTRDDLEAAAILLGVRILDRTVQEGDMYLAGRNTGVKLLTAKAVDPRNWVIPIETAYPYDTHECVPVEENKEG